MCRSNAINIIKTRMFMDEQDQANAFTPMKLLWVYTHHLAPRLWDV